MVDRVPDRSVAEEETKCFFMKMFADSYQATDAGRALELYNYTMSIKLPASSAPKLDCALSFSVFYYQVMGDTQAAIALSESILSASLSQIDSLKED